MSQSANKTRLLPFFVYGTLLPGQPNDFYWNSAITHSEPAVFEGGHLFSLDYFPMMIESKFEDNRSGVTGLLISVNPDYFDELLENLDQLEGFNPSNPQNSHYQRVVRPVKTKSAMQDAWLYIGSEKQVEGYPKIKDGNWLKHFGSQSVSPNEMDKWWQTHGIDLLFGKIQKDD